MPDVSIFTSPSHADLLANNFYDTLLSFGIFLYRCFYNCLRCNSNAALWFRFSRVNHPLSYGSSTVWYCLLNLNSKLHMSLFIPKPTSAFPWLQKQYDINSKKGQRFYLQMSFLPRGDRIQCCAQGVFENHQHRPHCFREVLISTIF